MVMLMDRWRAACAAHAIGDIQSFFQPCKYQPKAAYSLSCLKLTDEDRQEIRCAEPLITALIPSSSPRRLSPLRFESRGDSTVTSTIYSHEKTLEASPGLYLSLAPFHIFFLSFGYYPNQSLRFKIRRWIGRYLESGLEVKSPESLEVAPQSDRNKYYTGGPVSGLPDQSTQFQAKSQGRSRNILVLAVIAIVGLAVAIGAGLGAGLAAQHKSTSSLH